MQAGGLEGLLREQLDLDDDEVAPLMAVLRRLGVKRPEVSIIRIIRISLLSLSRKAGE